MVNATSGDSATPPEQGAGYLARFRQLLATRWGKRAAILFILAVVGWAGIWLIFARGLPSAETLLSYEPPLPTNVRSIDGEPVHSFARERRVELAFDEFPPQLIHAFLSAEDKTFFSHGGIDFPGLIGAVFDY